MYTGFILELRVCTLSLNLKDDFFVPADANRIFGENFGLPAFVFSIA